MRTLILNNLVSGYQNGIIYDFIRTLAQDGDEVVVRCTNGTSDIHAMLADAQSFDAVVASGGHNTLSSVSYILANTRIPVLPFPAGKHNLLPTNLMSPNEIHALATLYKEQRCLDFDLGEVEVSGHKFGFTSLLACGHDSNGIKALEKIPLLEHPEAYYKKVEKVLNPEHVTFNITVDGVEHCDKGIGLLIANFSGAQFKATPLDGTLPRDGKLDAIVVKNTKALSLVHEFLNELSAKGESQLINDEIVIYQGAEFSIESDPVLKLKGDGGLLEMTTPFACRVLPRAANFIVSEECLNFFGK